jgi:hypothetical protein
MIQGTFCYSLPSGTSALSTSLIKNDSNSFTFYENDFSTEKESPYYIETTDADRDRTLFTYYFKYESILDNDGFTCWDANVNEASAIIQIESFGNIPLSKSGLNFREYFGQFPIDPDDIPYLLPGTNISGMFYHAKYFNQNIGPWDVSSFTNFSAMFQRAWAFDQDISSWNMQNATNVSNMFMDARAFDHDIGSWNVSNVEDASGMFMCSDPSFPCSFNQNITGWNMSSLRNMSNMFTYAEAFDQLIGNWEIPELRFAYNALDDCGLSIVNYSNLLESWSYQELQPNVVLGANNLIYSQSALSFQTQLITNYNWTMQGDSMLKITPTLFNFSLEEKTLGISASPFTIKPPASTSPGTFSYVSSNTSIAQIVNGNQIQLNNAGNVTITAIQSSTSSYYGSSITAPLKIYLLGSLNIPDKSTTDESFEIEAPFSVSDGTISYTSSNSLVASIDGSVITLVGDSGSIKITATQEAFDIYPSDSTIGTFNVYNIIASCEEMETFMASSASSLAKLEESLTLCEDLIAGTSKTLVATDTIAIVKILND